MLDVNANTDGVMSIACWDKLCRSVCDKDDDEVRARFERILATNYGRTVILIGPVYFGVSPRCLSIFAFYDHLMIKQFKIGFFHAEKEEKQTALCGNDTLDLFEVFKTGRLAKDSYLRQIADEANEWLGIGGPAAEALPETYEE